MKKQSAWMWSLGVFLVLAMGAGSYYIFHLRSEQAARNMSTAVRELASTANCPYTKNSRQVDIEAHLMNRNTGFTGAPEALCAEHRDVASILMGLFPEGRTLDNAYIHIGKKAKDQFKYTFELDLSPVLDVANNVIKKVVDTVFFFAIPEKKKPSQSEVLYQKTLQSLIAFAKKGKGVFNQFTFLTTHPNGNLILHFVQGIRTNIAADLNPEALFLLMNDRQFSELRDAYQGDFMFTGYARLTLEANGAKGIARSTIIPVQHIGISGAEFDRQLGTNKKRGEFAKTSLFVVSAMSALGDILGKHLKQQVPVGSSAFIDGYMLYLKVFDRTFQQQATGLDTQEVFSSLSMLSGKTLKPDSTGYCVVGNLPLKHKYVPMRKNTGSEITNVCIEEKLLQSNIQRVVKNVKSLGTSPDIVHRTQFNGVSKQYFQRVADTVPNQSNPQWFQVDFKIGDTSGKDTDFGIGQQNKSTRL